MHRSGLTALTLLATFTAFADTLPRPDFTVAADGTGDFKTIQAAVASISQSNRERLVIFIKDGVYHEKIRVTAPFLTLRGQSREGTRIEFPQSNDEFTRQPDKLGRAVINLDRADDFVLENLTAENTDGVIGPHAFAIYGTGDRTVIVNCNVWSHGADTVSLWLPDRGRYYHANCSFRGSVDFVCPRGWCYATNCTFYEWKDTAAVWHDGSRNPDMKFVLRHCRFDGTNGWNLARHHHDAQFYFLDCTFAKTMIDRAPFRVIYPLDGSTPGEADIRRNKDLDRSNVWGERAFFFNCHRDGGDYAWLRNNLASATNAPSPEQITAAWTFGNTWDPERKSGPRIQKVSTEKDRLILTFDERVTVKGRLRISCREAPDASGRPRRLNVSADYVSGSGTTELILKLPENFEGPATPTILLEGIVVASEASAELRVANIFPTGATMIIETK